MTNIKPGTLVELVAGFDHLYNPVPENYFKGVYVGARATVRECKDHDGFPHIFLEWDRADWRYAGMPDGWSYENHFRAVAGAKAVQVRTDNASQIILTVKDLTQRAQDSRACPDCGEIHDEEEMNKKADYLLKLMMVEANMMSADAFAMITVHPEAKGFDSDLIQADLTDKAREALENAIIDAAATIVKRRLEGDGK